MKDLETLLDNDDVLSLVHSFELIRESCKLDI